MHKALRTPDILEIIFSQLDILSLASANDCCETWRVVIIRASIWKKYTNRLAGESAQNLQVLSQKGLAKTFDDSVEESEHFKALCLKLHTFNTDWKNLEPNETFLNCSPANVNEKFNFKWDPWWVWNKYKNQGGWLAGLATSGQFLLCGVIETLQVWDLKSMSCVSILTTPREDYVQGVDIALNCLDLVDNIAVSGSNEGVIRIWDIKTKQFTWRQDCSQYGAVNSLKLVSQSESGQRGNLFLLSGHDDGQLILWSVVSSAEVILISIILDFENILWSIDFSENYIASCSENKTIAVLNKQQVLGDKTGLNDSADNDIGYLYGHTDAVTCVSVTDKTLVSGARDKTVIVWMQSCNSTWKQRGPCFFKYKILLGHEELLHYVAQDEDRIYSSDDGGELFVWDKRKILSRKINQEDLILRRVDYGESRGAIDCMKVVGSKLYLSFDDFSSIAIQDFW